MLGDPGTAKSQLLKFVEKCSPIGVSVWEQLVSGLGVPAGRKASEKSCLVLRCAWDLIHQILFRVHLGCGQDGRGGLGRNVNVYRVGGKSIGLSQAWFASQPGSSCM